MFFNFYVTKIRGKGQIVMKARRVFWCKCLISLSVKSSLRNKFLYLIALGLFCYFIGFGAGRGEKIADKIEKSEIDYTDQIEFINGDIDNVAIVGSNSTFIFYLEKENKNVQISPINGIIKSIEKSK